MKETIRRIGGRILENDFFFSLCNPVFKLNNALRHLRTYNEKVAEKKRILSILKDPVVKNGPFKNMVYPPFSSTGTAVYPNLFGSAIYPKIIGSYEAELHSVINKI